MNVNEMVLPNLQASGKKQNCPSVIVMHYLNLKRLTRADNNCRKGFTYMISEFCNVHPTAMGGGERSPRPPFRTPLFQPGGL